MMSKYGDFSDTQIDVIAHSIRKSIYFLLLYVDPDTKDNFPNVDIDEAFLNIQCRLNGLNSLLNYPKGLVTVMTMIEAAQAELKKDELNFRLYKKLLFDAGAEILKLKCGD